MTVPLVAGSAPDGVAPADPAPLPQIQRGFDYEREVPPEWTQRLREVSPKSDTMGFLDLIWEPGDPWMPAQRWMLYECIHPSLANPFLVEQLRGPHPRKEGHICTSVPVCDWAVPAPPNYQPCLCRHKLDAWKGSQSAVALTEWTYFQRTGYVARNPFWIIQGTRGGHRAGFTHQEQQLLEKEGYPTDAPAPGVLPYAPFDERVVQAIGRFNRLWKFNGDIERYRKVMGEGYAAYQADVEKELRRQLVDELKNEQQDVYDLFVRAAENGELDDQPRTDIDYERLDEQNDEHYIETGQILHHSLVKW